MLGLTGVLSKEHIEEILSKFIYEIRFRDSDNLCTRDVAKICTGYGATYLVVRTPTYVVTAAKLRCTSTSGNFASARLILALTALTLEAV